jgi:chromosome segregation ATPase
VPEPEKRPDEQPVMRSGREQGCTDKGSTKPQWLKWLSEQLSGVADQLEEEEGQREQLTRSTTQELVMLRTQLHELQGELLKANERVQQAQDVTEPVGTSRSEPEQEEVIATLQEELQAQAALRENEREQRKLVEDDRRRMEEGLRRSKATNDRLQEEKEKLQKEKDRL